MRQKETARFIRRRQILLHNRYISQATSTYNVLFQRKGSPAKSKASKCNRAQKDRLRNIEQENVKLLLTLNSISSRKSNYKRAKTKTASRDKSLRVRQVQDQTLLQNLRLLKRLQDARPSLERRELRQHQRQHSRLQLSLRGPRGQRGSARRTEDLSQSQRNCVDQKIIRAEVELDQ